VSHAPAALLWGLPLLRTPERTHVIVRTRPAGRTSDVVRHRTDLPETHRTTHRGFAPTTLERTVVDCATTLRARAVLALADDGAEPPGESSARFVLLRAGLPEPETQVPVLTHLGTFWADLGWPAWRLLAEYDGRTQAPSCPLRAAETDVLTRDRRVHASVSHGYVGLAGAGPGGAGRAEQDRAEQGGRWQAAGTGVGGR